MKLIVLIFSTIVLISCAQTEIIPDQPIEVKYNFDCDTEFLEGTWYNDSGSIMFMLDGMCLGVLRFGDEKDCLLPYSLQTSFKENIYFMSPLEDLVCGRYNVRDFIRLEVKEDKIFIESRPEFAKEHGVMPALEIEK